MNKRKTIILAGFILLTVLTASSFGSESCFAEKGKTFTIKLPANPTTGYLWQITELDAKYFTVEASGYTPSSRKLVGAGGVSYWEIVSLKAGRSSLHLLYYRPWEGKKQAIDERKIEVWITDATVILRTIRAGTEYYRLDIRYPEFKEYNKLNARILGYVLDLAEDLQQNAREFQEKEKTRTEKPPFKAATLSSDYRVNRVDKIASVSFITEIFPAGAAHPTNLLTAVNYDLVKNNILELKDIFKPDSSKYLKYLSQYAADQLLKENPQLGRKENMEQFKQGTAPKEDNFKNFYLTGDSLVLVFGEYQIGPRPFGIQKVKIPFEKLLPFLKEDITTKTI